MNQKMWRAVCECFSKANLMVSPHCVKCGRPGEYDGWHMGMTEALGAYEKRLGLKALGPHLKLATALFDGRFEACPTCQGRGVLDADEGRTWMDCPRCQGACRLFKGTRQEFMKIRSQILSQFPGSGMRPFSPADTFFKGEGEPDPVGKEKAETIAPEFFSPEAQIRCVFYTLVVRNEALKGKWKDGLQDYWRKYNALHNDDISTNCFMGPYWDEQIDALIANGLKARTDFALFDASDVIVWKAYEPFPMPVGWLAGYVLKGGVMIYMKQ